MFSTLCLRSRLLYSLQYCWKIEPFLFSSNIAATFSKSFKRVFPRNEKFLVQYCCQYCTRILVTYLHDQKYCCNIATRNRAQESCSCKAGLKSKGGQPATISDSTGSCNCKCHGFLLFYVSKFLIKAMTSLRFLNLILVCLILQRNFMLAAIFLIKQLILSKSFNPNTTVLEIYLWLKVQDLM